MSSTRSTLRRLPERRASAHWSTLGASLLEGELAIIEGDLAAAVQLMTPAVEQIHAMGGGSREQKDIFASLAASAAGAHGPSRIAGCPVAGTAP